ncbi:phage tail family protein [Cellulomonas sp. SG140]|uniref:phage tail family protein n=1 Tax=Cellulomonas sp. SG140 TaxID=2976536 RepID=UPI0021E71DEC|nr:phage tail family protein [Cellulomonas sp. SG140]
MATNRGLLPDLSRLKVSASQMVGSLDLENSGDADAYPVWEVRGPGNHFKAVAPSGDTLEWTGSLLEGQTITINTELGTCVDQTGANRYSELATAPRMWAIPPGVTRAAVQFLDTTAGKSRIAVSWRPRRWLAI